MFAFASSFNSDLSQWDVCSCKNFSFMFYSASSFNRNLCSWGEHWTAPSGGSVNMFVGTACPMTSDPVGADGPFCHACT